MPGTIYIPVLCDDKGAAPGAGVTPAATLEVANNGLMWLDVTGVTGAASITIHNQTTQDGNAGPDLVIATAAGGRKIIGPFPRGLYNNAAGNIEVAINTPANIASLFAFNMKSAV